MTDVKKNSGKNGISGLNFFLLIPLLMSAALVCGAILGAGTHSIKDRRPGTIVTAISKDPTHLNPILASDGISMNVNSFIFNSLVRYDESLNIIPDIAESWEIEEGGRRIVFKIRRGVKFHDGSPLTAHDCEFTFRKILDPHTNTFNRGLLRVRGEKNETGESSDVDVQFTVLNDYELEARMPAPFAPFLNNLTLIGIVPQSILKNEDINTTDFNLNPVGTGPFKFNCWKTSDSIELVKNPDYHRGCPRLERIILSIVPSTESRRIAFFSGQVDIVGLAGEDLMVMENRIPENLNIYQWNNFTYFYFAFDLTNPLFSRVNVRRAINYAVDNETLTASVLHGKGSPIYGPIPVPSWAYNPDVERYPYNPDLARRMLKEEGWNPGKDGILEKDGKRFSFDLIYPSGSYPCESASVYLQSYLRDVGMEVKLQPLDYGALINSLYPEKFQSVVFDWVEPFDPDIFTEWHSSQFDDGMNFMSYANPRVDRLLEEARYTFDRDVRKRKYGQIQKLIALDAPYVFLWNQEAIVGVNGRVKGLPPPSPLGFLHEPEKIGVED